MVTDQHLADEDAAIRCYFLGKLRVATNGMPGPVLGCMSVHTNLHNIWETRPGLKLAVEGDPVLKACIYIAPNIHNLEDGRDSGAIWVAGLKGLLYGVKGYYKAAKDFLCRCVVIADPGELGSHFFHEYVVSLFAEALGYLLTHVMDFRVPILDCSQSAPCNCQNAHAIYPFFLHQLGLLQEEGAHVQYTEDIFESLLEFARLNPCWPEASCACFHAYYRAAMGVLDQDARKARIVFLEGLKQAHMTSMECSLWKALGEMEFECTNFRHALKAYSKALDCRLAGPDQDALQHNNISTQLLCQRIMELVPLVGSTLPASMQGPAADADPADFLAFALWVLSLCETRDVQMVLWDKVASLVAVKQQTYPWIAHALQQLELGYSRAGAYSSAAEVCIVHSRMNSVYVRLGQLSKAMNHWYQAGELGKALEIVEEQIIPTFAQLDESDWELQARLQISAASYFALAGRSNEAFALKQAATDLVACRGLSSSEYKLHEDLLKGVVSLLRNYRHRKNWPLAEKLVKSFDTQIHNHFSGTAKWKQWQMLKANIAHDLGEYESASTILREVKEILEDRADPEPDLQHSLLLLRAIAHQNAYNGNWKRVLKTNQQILKELQKLPPCLKIKHIEMSVHILSAKALIDITGEKGKAELEIEKAVKLYDMWSMSGDLDGADHNRYASLFVEGLANVRLMQAQMALQMDHEAETAWKLTKVAESLVSLGNSASLAGVKYVQALVREKQEQWREAAKLAREAVIMATILQRKISSVEPEATAWNWFFCTNMKKNFWLLQMLYVTLKQPEIGLLWAERANMRCFLHQINTQPLETPLLNLVDLDECDTLLQSVILTTARSLSATTAIIHYSYNPNSSQILMYVVKHLPTAANVREKIGVQVIVKVCNLPIWFENAGLPHTTRLEVVIKKARTDIQNGADKEAPTDIQNGADRLYKKARRPIKDLCTLYSLLIEFIEEDLENCDTLVIAPGHGCLSSVPFAALTNLRTGKFLVESKALALIPSILTLHHCLHRQLRFEMNNQLPVPEDVSYLSSFLSCNPNVIEMFHPNWVPSRVAFMAGNPEPMGLGLPHLENARFEVSLVASYFGVQPCLGRNMSKKAVLEGLASSSVVLLATHGIVDDWYPYGCLVMKGLEGAVPTDKESRAHRISIEQPKSVTISYFNPSEGWCGEDQQAAEGGAVLIADKESCAATSITISIGKCKRLSEGCGAGGGEEEQASSSNVSKQYGDGSNRISILKAMSSTVSEAKGSEGCGGEQALASCAAASIVLMSKGKGKGKLEQASNNSKYGGGHRIFKHTDESSKRKKEEEEEEVLTAAEIAGLEGGISAGMVVLSACESGLGEETESEGVLGLGRALLQGGAACALLTLWKVNDGCNMVNITALFHCAFIDPSTRGKTVCECLRLVMQGLIDRGLPIEMWAALQMMGSPLLRLSAKHDNMRASWLDECAFVLFNSLHGARCPQPCGVCDRQFESEDSHGLPEELESFPVHPHIGRLVETYARPLLDQLPPLEDKHVLIKFPDEEFRAQSLPVAFIVKPDGNVRQVVQKQRNI